MINSACYCTREQVQGALDYKETARNKAQVDRAIEAGTEAVQGFLHRSFLPEIATRYFRWPDRAGTSYRLWLDKNELISLSALSSGGTAISSQNYFLEPQQYGPPYDRVELNTSTSASFGGGDTPQRDISITGVWGYWNSLSSVGTTSEALDDSETEVQVSDVANIGVGNLLKVENEWMVVQEKNLITTAQTLQSNMNELESDDVVDVTNGSLYFVGEVLTIDTEKMLIIDVAGNNLSVKRAWDGSVLSDHTTGATIYAPRSLQVIRGANGSTAASHSTSTVLYRQQVPALVQELCLAEAINFLLQESAGYARTVGQGDYETQYTGAGLKSIRAQAKTRHGRQARMRSV